MQGTIAQLLLGHQTETVKTFLSLSPAQRTTFSGWSTAGWVRWLAGLRGAYERRMTRMCRILDTGLHAIRDVPAGRDAVAVLKEPRMSFDWPRGGMFAWVQVHLARHRLCARDGEAIPFIAGRQPCFSGAELAKALLLFLTTEPYKLLVSPGTMFAATPEIARRDAWGFYRLCFAAESDERVDASSRMFVRGVHDFFEIKDAAEIRKLLEGP